MLATINVILWLIIGIGTLCQKEVSKWIYGLTWGLLMVHLIVRVLEVNGLIK